METPPTRAVRTVTRARRAKSLSFLYFLIPIAFFLGIGGGYLLRGVVPLPSDAGTANTAGAATTEARVDVSTDGDPSVGPKNAPVTIIEFSDYQCPYCQLWYQNVYKQLLAKYPNKIRFVYRDLPLSFHPESLPAAVAANCAGEQNAYWQFHDALFSEQTTLGRDAYLQTAASLGLNVDTFTKCIDSGQMEAEINADAADAARVGLSGTPSFVINGRIVVGALPLADFEKIVDEELAKAK